MSPSRYKGYSQLALASFCGHKGAPSTQSTSLSLCWNNSIPDTDLES